MSKKLYVITGIILIAKLCIACNDASSSATEPLSQNAVNPSSQVHATVESPQEWLERRLREVGKLKEGQHLKPHQVWQLVDQLTVIVENRLLFTVIRENKQLLLNEGISEHTINKALRGLLHSKTSSFQRIVHVLKKHNIDIPSKDSAKQTTNTNE